MHNIAAHIQKIVILMIIFFKLPSFIARYLLQNRHQIGLEYGRIFGVAHERHAFHLGQFGAFDQRRQLYRVVVRTGRVVIRGEQVYSAARSVKLVSFICKIMIIVIIKIAVFSNSRLHGAPGDQAAVFLRAEGRAEIHDKRDLEGIGDFRVIKQAICGLFRP